MIVDDDLIAKFLSGEASPEEAMALHEWLAVPANKTRFDEMSSTWDEANPAKAFKSLNKEGAWRKIKPAKNLVWPIGIAASVLLVISVLVIRNTGSEIAQLTESTQDTTKDVSLADNSRV